MNFEHKLGFALVPHEDDQKKIYELSDILNKNLDLGFRVTPESAIPHITGFQGIFADIEMIKIRLNTLNFSFLDRNQSIQGLSLWAQKIIFLDYKNTQLLRQFHQLIIDTFEKGTDYQGTSADPQNFDGITSGQQAAFDMTGYPFYGDEFLPHTTMAHLQKAQSQEEKSSLNQFIKRSSIGDTIEFIKVVIFEVEALGKSTNILWEKDLA